MQSIKRWGLDRTQELDLLQLFWPLLLVVLVVSETVFFGKAPSDIKPYLKILEDVIFLDGLHVVFSYYFLVGLRGSKSYIQEMKHIGINLPLRLMFFFCACFLVSFYFTVNKYDSIASPKIFYFLTLLIPIHHTFNQSKGLLFLEMKNPPLKYKALIETYFWILILRNLAFGDPNFLKLSKEVSLVLGWTTYGLGLCMYVAFLIFGLRGESVRTKIFSIRFLLHHLQPFSALATYMIGSIHGLEYLYVSSKTINNEHKITNRQRGIVCSFIVISFVVSAVLIWPHYYLAFLAGLIPVFQNSHVLSITLASLGFALTYTHYLMDHYLYSARYLPSRNYFLNILKRPTSPAKENLQKTA